MTYEPKVGDRVVWEDTHVCVRSGIIEHIAIVRDTSLYKIWYQDSLKHVLLSNSYFTVDHEWSFYNDIALLED